MGPEACTFIYEAIFQQKGRVLISSKNTNSRSIAVLIGFLGLIQGVTSVEDIFFNADIKSRYILDEKYRKPVDNFLTNVEIERKRLCCPPLSQNLVLNDEGLFEDKEVGKVKKIVWFDDP